MDLQNQMDRDWSRYFCYEQSLEFKDEDNNLSLTDLQCSPVRMDRNSNPYCNFWMHSYSGSFAMDARIRLEALKSGTSTSLSTCTVNGSMYSYNYAKDIWDLELNVLTVLDSVELLDVEGEDEQDEESWLYISPKKYAFLKKTEPTLRWCRHVLDNRSPEIEAACRWLMNKLNQNNSDHNVLPDSSHKLQNITDVYDMARLQEASLRQDFVYMPRSPESPLTPPPRSNTIAPNTYNSSHRNRTGTSTCQASDPVDQPPTPVTEQSYQSPKLARFHQYKLLKHAQNQGSSSRSSSPLRTSLRSLQAVRSSRSLDISDYSLDQILHPRAGRKLLRENKTADVSSMRTSSSCRSSSHSNHSDMPVQSTAIKRCQRSHSLSPSRVPSISSQGHVFESPERSRAVWLSNGGHPQR